MTKKITASSPKRKKKLASKGVAAESVSAKAAAPPRPLSSPISVMNASSAIPGLMNASLSIALTYEYAVVPENEWDAPGGRDVHVSSRQATEQDIGSAPCYEFSSVERSRNLLTEIGRRVAPECRSGTEFRWVLVRLLSFRGSLS